MFYCTHKTCRFCKCSSLQIKSILKLAKLTGQTYIVCILLLLDRERCSVRSSVTIICVTIVNERTFEKKGDTSYTLLKMRTYKEACIGTPVIDQSRGPAVSWRISCCRSSGSRIMRNYKIYANRRRKRTVSTFITATIFFFSLDIFTLTFLYPTF